MTDESARLAAIETNLGHLSKDVQEQTVAVTKLTDHITDPENGLAQRIKGMEGKQKGQAVEIAEIKSKDKQRTGWLMGSVIGIAINSIFDVFKRGG